MDETNKRLIREFRDALESCGPYGEDCSAGECERYGDYVTREVGRYESTLRQTYNLGRDNSSRYVYGSKSWDNDWDSD